MVTIRPELTVLLASQDQNSRLRDVNVDFSYIFLIQIFHHVRVVLKIIIAHN